MLIDQKILQLNLKSSDVMAERKMGFHGPLTPGVIYGVRYNPTETTNGWYVWKGKRNDSPDFFQARHAAHIISENPYLAKYLMLPPGYEFLTDTTNGHEDIWFDDKSLIV
jgi:hypothetical protein